MFVAPRRMLSVVEQSQPLLVTLGMAGQTLHTNGVTYMPS
jgi:hypothetical protein